MIVNVAYYRETHIDAESGHDRVIAGLADRVDVRTMEPCVPRVAPERLLKALAPSLGKHGRMSFYEPSALALEFAVIRKLATAPGEIVHMLQGDTHFNYTAWTRLLSRRRRGTLVATFHQPPEKFEEIWRFARKRARLDALDGMTVVSDTQVEYFRPLVGDRVTKVPFGVNRRIFNPPPQRPVRDGVRVLAVGAWLRDPRLLRDTIDRVATASPNVAFTVLAPPAYLEAVGEAPRTTRRSAVHGPELIAEYHAADVFLHSAASSTASTAMLEAMACGLPIVVPGVGGVREYADERCAIITAPGDPDALAEGILLLAADPERRRAMGRCSDERTRRLDWPYIAHEYVNVYERALARHRGSPLSAASRPS